MDTVQDVVRVSQIKATWAHVMHDGVLLPQRKSATQQYPEHSVLLQTELRDPPEMNDVLIRDPDQHSVAEMRQWLDENARRKYKMFARFEWVDDNFSIRRKFQGLLFRFVDDNTAFFFKMVWFPGI